MRKLLTEGLGARELEPDERQAGAADHAEAIGFLHADADSNDGNRKLVTHLSAERGPLLTFLSNEGVDAEPAIRQPS